MKTLAIVAGFLASGPAAGAQDVLVVDAAGAPGTYPDVATAVAAAAEGDLLLVKAGQYGRLVIDGKSLRVQAEAGATVHVDQIDVLDLGPSQFVSVRGFEAAGVSFRLIDNQGPVWLEDCTADHRGAALVRNCTDVVLRSVRIDGGNDSGFGAALTVEGSRVALYDTELTGPVIGAEGTEGLCIHPQSTVTVYGGSIVGGDGIDVPGPGGCPGVGIRLHGDGSTLELIGASVEAGQAQDCSTQPLSSLGNNTIHQLQNTAHLLTTPSPLRSSQATSVTLHGDPLDVAFALIAPSPGAFFRRPNWVGPLVLGPSTLTLERIGTLDATGSATWNLSAPPVPLDVSVLSFYVQGLFLSTSPAEIALGTPTQIHVLNAAF